MKDSKVYVIKRQMQQLRAWCALQLADFLALRIDKAGGMMPLPDVYCLFNRARGAELISPDDLLTAAKLLSATGARLTFRQFASGVLVVQSAAHSDEKVGPRSRLISHGCLPCSLALRCIARMASVLMRGSLSLLLMFPWPTPAVRCIIGADVKAFSMDTRNR